MFTTRPPDLSKPFPPELDSLLQGGWPSRRRMMPRHVEDLNLSECQGITDAGLRHVAKMPELVTLSLDHCAKITDAGLAHLAQAEKLRHVSVSYCTGMTRTAAHALGQSRPGLVVSGRWC